MKKYLVLSNDKIFLKNEKISSDFNDVINIIESIGKKYEIFFIRRKKENYLF